MTAALSSDVSTRGVPMPAVGTGFGDFHLLDHLGEGASSVVYLAREQASEGLVALKVSRSTSLEEGFRWSREATTLERIGHPNIVEILSHGVSAQRSYLAMNLCRGRSLGAWVADGPMGAARVAEVVRQVALALAHAHERGILHRDIKPSNVMLHVDADVLDLRVLDFGFVGLVGKENDGLVGTFLYMSPEQLGIIACPVDERSDLYALGILGIELLSGQHPFAGRDVSSVIHAHAAAVPACPAGTPPGLCDVLAALCEKEPERRYQTAIAVARDLAIYLSRMSRGALGSFAISKGGRQHVLAVPQFQGRTAEMGLLQSAFRDARRGLEVVTVGGPSGIGKSELFKAAAERWTGSLVLCGRGRAYGQASAYGLFTEVLEDLANRSVPEGVARRMREAVGLLGGEVVRLVPQLEAVLGPAAALAEIEPEQRQQRFFGVMTQLVAALGAADAPLVLFFDDVQWADEGSLALAAHLVGVDLPLRVLVVAAYRTEAAESEGASRALTALSAADPHRIELPPLDPREVSALVASMLGSAPDEVVEVVEKHAHGSPLFAAELVRGLVEGSALVRLGDGWEVDTEILARIGHGQSLRQVIADRIGRLAPVSLEILTLASAAGRAFSPRVVQRAASRSEAEMDTALGEASRAHLVRPSLGGEIEFAHDKVREVLYEGLSEGQRREIHERIGAALETMLVERGPARVVFALAYHYGRSPMSDKAVRYGILAGELSIEAHAHAEALEFFDAASERLPTDEAHHAERARLHEGLGDAHRMLGQYDPALAHYASASKDPIAQLAAARIAGKVGGVYFSRGDAARAAEALIDALRALGERFPRTFVGLMTMIVWEFLVQIGHTVTSSARKPPARPVSKDPVLVEVGRVYSRLTYVYYFVDMLKLLAAHLRHMNLMERHNVESELGQAYSNHGPVCATVPMFSRGLAYSERSIALRQRLGDRFGTAQSRSFYGVTLNNAGRFQETIVQTQLARDELLRLGDRWELVTVLSQLGQAQIRLGAWEEATSAIDAIVVHARASNHSAGLAYAQWVRAYMTARTGTESSLAEIEECLPVCERAGDAFSVIQLLQSRGRLQLRMGRVDAAIASLERAVHMMHTHLIHSDFVIITYPALADAYVAALEQTPTLQSGPLVRRAHSALRWAFLHTRPFPNERPYTWRVQGRLYWHLGKKSRARACFDQAQRLALDSGQPYQQALAWMELGRLTLSTEPVVGRGALRMAVPLLRALGAHEDLARIAPLLPEVERVEPAASSTRTTLHAVHLQELLVVGQRLSAIVGLDELLEQILASAVRLLGAERGVLFLCEPGTEGGPDLVPRATHAVADSEHPACTSVAHKAVASGRSLILADAQNDREFQAAESVVASGVRSVLCVPMRFKGGMLGVLYLDNRLIRGVFTEENLRILESLASAAAVALSNARAFAALADENQARLRSEREAQAASHAKSAFLANMSHELRTPLNAILGYTEMVTEDLAEHTELSASRDDLAHVRSAATHLLGIIEDVLDVSRIEAEKLTFQIGPVLLDPLLTVEIEQGLPLARERGNQLSCTASPGLLVAADPQRLRQVLKNLLSNAIKFTENGRVQVAAEARGDKIVISVSDTGIGLSSQALERVFERFHQVDDAPTRRYGGMGLGLSISRALVTGMGGEITVESEVGRGSTFQVSLPRWSRQVS